MSPKDADEMANSVDPDQAASEGQSDLGLHCLPGSLQLYANISTYEPPHDKNIKMIYARSEDSEQPGHPPCPSESSLCTQWVAKDPSFLHADSEETGLI